MATVWQQLGAFVVTAQNLRDEQLAGFSQVGGRWICPVTYNDDASGPWNTDHFAHIKQWANQFNVHTGIWCNGNGGDPQKDAQNIAALVKTLRPSLCILDLETKYQYPEGDPSLMPRLVQSLRNLLPNFPLGVSTNGLNSASIWNGRVLDPPRSFYRLGIRVLPQWYSSYYQNNGAIAPSGNMRWLHDNCHLDFNFLDPNAPFHRGVPLSYVHGTVEVSGLEGSSLLNELQELNFSKHFGYTKGFSIYTLENMPASDLNLLQQFNYLWLV